MNLPNAHLAMAEQEKICGYLLNPAHPDNGGKAQFFMALALPSHREQSNVGLCAYFMAELGVLSYMQ